MPIDQQPTFTGENAIVVNEETVRRVFKEWLEVNMSGGPWEVVDFQKEYAGYKVSFRDAKKENTSE